MIRRAVRPRCVSAFNVPVEGTTHMQMFDPGAHCLLPPKYRREKIIDWRLVLGRIVDLPAPDGKLKRFATVIARRPLV